MTGKRLHLKRAREAAGYTQESLAAALGVSEQTVRNWEAGRATPLRGIQPRLAMLLNVTREDLSAMLSGKRSGALAAADASIVAPTAPAGASDAHHCAGGLLVSAADESSEFLHWVEKQDVGALSIEGIHDDLRLISATYLKFSKVSTVPLFLRAKAVRERCFELLRTGHRTPSVGRDLYSAAGWALALLGWMTVDFGGPEIAKKHLRTAWGCAERADDRTLRAWVRATQHTACFWQEDYDTAAKHAEDGLRYAESDSARLFLASARALDLARGGHVERSRAALRSAEAAADAGAADVSGSAGMAGPFRCSVGRAGGLWSDAYLAQNEPERALEHSSVALAEFQRTAPNSRNQGSERMVRCQVIKSHLTLGNFDLALDEMQAISVTPSQYRVGPLVRRVREIHELSQSIMDRSPRLAELRSVSAEFRPDSALKQLSN